MQLLQEYILGKDGIFFFKAKRWYVYYSNKCLKRRLAKNPQKMSEKVTITITKNDGGGVNEKENMIPINRFLDEMQKYIKTNKGEKEYNNGCLDKKCKSIF